MVTMAATSRTVRLWRHLVTDRGSVRRAFPDAMLGAIEAAVAAGEQAHRGQLCVAIEAALPPGRALGATSPRDRALEVFGLLRVWDTEENAGVLVYVLLADRDVEIVADRAIHRLVGEAYWQEQCAVMEAAARAGRLGQGVLKAVEAISATLATHFPREGVVRNEIPDRPTLL
jgi:uncharacterized membrane protein